LLFVVLERMTGARQGTQNEEGRRQNSAAFWCSAMVAALFALHPLHVESVAWIAERKDVLSAFFFLLALWAYVRYAGDTVASNQWPVTSNQGALITDYRLPFYFLSLCCFALALMSKAMVVTLPFILLLLDYWPLGRMQSAECRMQNPKTDDTHHAPRTTLLHLVREKIPFFVLAALTSIVTFIAQKRGGSLAAGEHLPLGGRLGNAVIGYGCYLRRLVWPADLAVFYPHPGYWPLVKVLLTGGLLLSLLLLVWALRQRCPALLLGWLWYCGTLVPVSQMVQTGGMAMADRWTYLPSIGVLILTVWGVHEMTRRWQYQVSAVALAGGAVIVLCLALTRQQLGYWRDSEALFQHALEVTENNSVAHNGLGAALGRKGQLDAAIRHLQPDHGDAHYNLGVVLGKKGQIVEAIRQLEEACRLQPGRADAHSNLGAALFLKGQTDEAIRQLQEAIRLEPDHADAHYNLAVALGSRGQTDEAIPHYQAAARLKPDNADAHYNLGLALGSKGQTDEAIRQFQETLKLKPNYPAAREHLNALLATRPDKGVAPPSTFTPSTRSR